MRVVRVFLVRLSRASRPVALAAARAAFRDVEIVEVETVAEAGLGDTVRRPELLVLAEPEAATVVNAMQAVDANGLPRWAVVIMGGDLWDLAETVPPEEWDPPLLARVFRSAILQHELLSENLRLQGDLRTVARRISHDLYTPVGCIYTSSQVLKIILSPDGMPSIAVMVRNIEDSSAEISQIIERVSFVLRASADPATPVPVEMAGVVGSVLRQLEPDIQKAGATVTQPPSWPDLRGVSQWLHVIWWNLLHNALKHGGPAAKIALGWTSEADGHRFSVTDHGAGIATAGRPGLFRPFDQLHLLPAPGLGLPIVQRLVALQGGHCGYEQLDDGTSVFHFTLPAVSARRESQDSPAGGAGSLSAKTRDNAAPAGDHRSDHAPKSTRAPGAAMAGLNSQFRSP